MNKIFEKGGKLHWLHSTVDAFETFLHVPGTVALKGAHVRDAVDIKRIMIIAVIAAGPAALFGMWNVGYQHALATGISMNVLRLSGSDSSRYFLCIWCPTSWDWP